MPFGKFSRSFEMYVAVLIPRRVGGLPKRQVCVLYRAIWAGIRGVFGIPDCGVKQRWRG